MIRECLLEVIAQTEFAGRAINRNIADDLSDRIKKITGIRIHSEELYAIFRNRQTEENTRNSTKNALAQFAQYHNWEHFISSSRTIQTEKQTFPWRIGLYTFILFIFIFLLINFGQYFLK